MGIFKKIKEEASAWERRRQLRRGVNKSFYEENKKRFEEVRQKIKEKEYSGFERAEHKQIRRASRNVFWREQTSNIIKPLGEEIRTKLRKKYIRRIKKIPRLRIV